ncbi:MAG TPA: transposase [Melioribacteraceae bacterium]|nr:transposase [Melioribacteraceae bacterium]
MRDDGIWLKPSEVMDLLETNKRYITRNIDKYEYRITTSNGGKTYFINLKSLPVEAQLKYYKQNDVTAEKTEKAVIIPLPEEPKRIINSKEASAKATIVIHFSNFVRYADSKVKAGEQFVEEFNAGKYPNLLNMVGEISLKSLYRWKKKLDENKGNIDCLEPKYKPIGCSSITDIEAEIIIPLILNPNRPLISEIISNAKHFIKARGIQLKSDATYRRFIENWKSRNIDLWTLGRDGSKAYNDRILKDILRDKDRIEVGDILVADGHKFNVMVINPLTGKATRMTLIMFYDFKSDMPVGWEIMPTENTLAIAGALRNAILRLGRFFNAEGYAPKVVYLDNGRAFRGKYFNGTKDFSDCEIPGLFEKLGIQTIFATPYHGQSKPIERWFKTLGELERRMPSYTGYNIDNKPAMNMRNEVLHKRLYDNSAISLETLQYNMEEFIKEYSGEAHVGGFYKGLSPAEIFMYSVNKIKQSGNYVERLISQKQLIYLMLQDTARKVGKNGIKFRGNYYFNEQMPSIISSKVTIKYDIWNDNEVYIFENGSYLFSASKDDSLYHPAAGILGTDDDMSVLTEAIGIKQRMKKQVVSDFKNVLSLGKEVLPQGNSTAVLPEKAKEEKSDKKKKKEEKKKISAIELYMLEAGYSDPTADPRDLLNNKVK